MDDGVVVHGGGLVIVGVGQDKVRTLVRALQKSHPRTHIGTAHAPAARRRVPREKRADSFRFLTAFSGSRFFFIYLFRNSARMSARQVRRYGMPAGNRTNNVDATQFTRQGSRFFGEPLHKNVARSQ